MSAQIPINVTYEECKSLLTEALKNNAIDSNITAPLRFLDVFYEPECSLESKLEAMGFSTLQIHSLVALYTMHICDTEAAFSTIPVINPADYEGKELPHVEWTVINMLPDGVSIIAAPPKYHKSFFALQLGVSVCSGMDFLGFETIKGDCIYFDLESNPGRPLNRLKDMYGTLDIEGLHIVTAQSDVKRLEAGFEDDLEMLLIRFPNTRLVIIDVLQYITPLKAKDNIYSSDYDTINRLNKIATKYKISILAVHHTRKMRDDSDPVNNITGTTGLTGAVSTIIEIMQESRTDSSALLLLTGNDIETQELAVHFDAKSLKWICDGDASEIAFKKFINRPESQTILKLMDCHNDWTGSAADLSEFAKSNNYDISAADFGRFIKLNKVEIFKMGFDVEQHRSSATRTITFMRHVENISSFPS